MSPADIFQNYLFQKILSGKLQVSKVSNGLDPDQIWVQTVCED